MSDNLPKIVRRSAQQIGAEEAALIYYLLSLHSTKPVSAKTGLQRLCAHYEADRRLPLSGPITREAIRDLVVVLFWHTDELVRRWAYKAAHWVARADDAYPLQERIRSEHNPENLTWGMAALISLANRGSVDAPTLTGRIEATPAMRLASRLFLKPAQLLLEKPLPLIKIDTPDSMLLKWGALLEGYGQAPDPLFEGNHPTGAYLEALTEHPDPEVAEYSVWARWKGKEYSLINLGVGLDHLQSLPGNVKRWAYRLLTKDASAVAANLDLMQEVAQSERDLRAREGLALGIRNLPLLALEPIVLDWYEERPEDDVRFPLIEHMAVNADLSADYAQEIVSVFDAARGDIPLRNRILAASVGTRVHPRLRSIEARDSLGHAASHYAQTEKGLFVTNVIVSGDGNSIGSISGNVFNSSVTAVRETKNVTVNEKDYLEQVLKFLGDADVRPSEKQVVASAVKAVAEVPSPENKNALIASLQSLATTSSSVVAVVEGVQKLVELGTALFGG